MKKKFIETLRCNKPSLRHAPQPCGEVPVGAVVMYQERVLSACGNQVEELQDPTAHAEVLALRGAARVLATPYLEDCDLYVTLEPCALCAAAISFSAFGAFISAPTKRRSC